MLNVYSKTRFLLLKYNIKMNNMVSKHGKFRSFSYDGKRSLRIWRVSGRIFFIDVMTGIRVFFVTKHVFSRENGKPVRTLTRNVIFSSSGYFISFPLIEKYSLQIITRLQNRNVSPYRRPRAILTHSHISFIYIGGKDHFPINLSTSTRPSRNFNNIH